MKTLKDFVSQVKDEVNPEVLEAEELPFVYEEGKQNQSGPHDPPNILIMRRKAIRQYPNGQKVALYYVDKINKYVTVPYTGLQVSSTMEEGLTPFEYLQSINENSYSRTITFGDGSKMSVEPKIASAMLELYNKLNSENRKKFAEAVNESKSSFNKLSRFALEN